MTQQSFLCRSRPSPRACLVGLLITMSPAALWAQSASLNFILHDAPRPLSDIRFETAEERSLSLADFRGKLVLLNIWATWCGPCRQEMPTLDRLQSKLGGIDFEVLALSIDRTGIEAVRKFYAEIGVNNLAMYIDSSGKSARDLGAVGLPTTLLIDRDGRELGRLVGQAEWDTPEMREFLTLRIKGSPGLPASALRDQTSNSPTDPKQRAAATGQRHNLDLPVTGDPISRVNRTGAAT